MALWVVLVVLGMLALGFIIWPMYRAGGHLTKTMAVLIVLVAGSSAALYHYIGSPNVPSGAGTGHNDGNAIVATLEQRLKDNPDDINGWIMLGRSYQTMQRYDEAVAAFETAVDKENGQNAQTLVGLGIVLLEKDGGELSERAAELFENALAIDPVNPNALFYGGGAAAQRGDTELAADRWESLLGLEAPPEIQESLQRQINQWRGLPPPVAAQPPVAAESPVAAQPPVATQPPTDAIVTLDVSVSDEARAELPADAKVFLIARDPAQPSPPIAVRPLRLAQLPMQVSLSDRDAMMAARLLSGFAEIEIVARVSLSGTPMQQSGDWSGSQTVSAGSAETIKLVIDQKIP